MAMHGFPVALYGMETFTWSETDAAQAQQSQATAWKRLLRVSSRAPHDAVAVVAGVANCADEWRVRRLAHFIRLANSPPDSLEHVALLVLHSVNAPW